MTDRWSNTGTGAGIEVTKPEFDIEASSNEMRVTWLGHAVSQRTGYSHSSPILISFDLGTTIGLTGRLSPATCPKTQDEANIPPSRPDI